MVIKAFKKSSINKFLKFNNKVMATVRYGKKKMLDIETGRKFMRIKI